ncbi:hypothetical protein CRI94_09780 [Longibacter salinarum]|uniref:Uncharacterized protein n=1 Tax=Longibacter salinarum TaxID=1850348 RepID=A0A2A8CYD0_9BACT|nr:hypothetical protein CRI94_09780 [Longibacter salinarum]
MERLAAQFDTGVWINLSDKIPGDTFVTTSMRLSHIRLYDIVLNGSSPMPEQTGIFLEPGAKAGIDFGFVRSYGTFGFTVPMTMFDDTRFSYEPVSLGFGISFDISHPFRE